VVHMNIFFYSITLNLRQSIIPNFKGLNNLPIGVCVV
jgi:hypothetical protein